MATDQGSSGVSNFYVFKMCLQHYSLKVGGRRTEYETYTEGPPNKPIYRSTVILNGIRYDSLPGFLSPKAAQESAAEVAVKELVKSCEVKECFYQLVHETGLCKTILKEYAQNRHYALNMRCAQNMHCAQNMIYALPKYECQKVEIPGSGRVTHFSCTVEIGGMRYIGPAAITKKEAAVKAARIALLAIQSSSSELSGLLGVLGDSSQLTNIPGEKTPSTTGDVKSNIVAAINTSGTVGLPVSQTVCAENTVIPGSNRSGLVETKVVKTPSALKPKKPRWKKTKEKEKKMGKQSPTGDVKNNIAAAINTSGPVGLPVSQTVCAENTGILGCNRSGLVETEVVKPLTALKPKISGWKKMKMKKKMRKQSPTSDVKSNIAAVINTSGPVGLPVSQTVCAENTGIPGCNRSGLVETEVVKTPSALKPKISGWKKTKMKKKMKKQSPTGDVKSNIAAAINTSGPVGLPVSQIVCAENTGIPGSNRSGLVETEVVKTPSALKPKISGWKKTKMKKKMKKQSPTGDVKSNIAAAINTSGPVGLPVSQIVCAENTGIPGSNRSGLVETEVVKTPSALKPKISGWKKTKMKKKMKKQSPTGDVKSNIAAAINTSGPVGLPVSQIVCAENTGIPGSNRSGLVETEVVKTPSALKPKISGWKKTKMKKKMKKQSPTGDVKSNIAAAINTSGPVGLPVSQIVCAENTGIPGSNRSGLVETEVVKTPSALKPKISGWKKTKMKKKMKKQSPTGDVKNNIAAAINTSGLVGLPVSRTVCAENTGIPGCNRSGLVGLQVTPAPSVSGGMLQVAIRQHLFRLGSCK